jgi:hypothetical protein
MMVQWEFEGRGIPSGVDVNGNQVSPLSEARPNVLVDLEYLSQQALEVVCPGPPIKRSTQVRFEVPDASEAAYSNKIVGPWLVFGVREVISGACPVVQA